MRVCAFTTLVSGAALLGIVLCCCFIASPVKAIDCLSAPDQSESGWWSWREIDGRKCWYKKVGAVPPKSEFRWPEHEKEAQSTEVPAQQELLPPPAEALVSTAPHIEVARVKPVEIKETNYRLGDDRIGLLEVFELSGPRGIGGIWEMPAHITDTFNARYGQW
jgi:hypothetical protein